MRTESINALVVPLVRFEITITTNANTKIGKNADTYDNKILNMLKDVPFTKSEAVIDKSIIKRRLAMIKLAIAKIFPKNTLNLEAGLVRVSLIVCSTNSPLNISIHTNAVNRGIKV